MTETAPPKSKLKLVRTLLWVLVALALIGTAALLLLRRAPADASPASSSPTATQASFGGPFTLVGADGKPFASSQLAGKPYAIFFGFTRCGDVCTTTLSRLAKLREQSGSASALNIVFVTIDPKNDGPRQVGQYAELFNTPIIGLTGTQLQIDQVKKQYGIFAEPDTSEGAHAGMINHTATVLLFDDGGKFSGTISASEPDADAVAKLKQLIA